MPSRIAVIGAGLKATEPHTLPPSRFIRSRINAGQVVKIRRAPDEIPRQCALPVEARATPGRKAAGLIAF